MTVTSRLSDLPADLSTGSRLLLLILQSDPSKPQPELAALTGATVRSIRNWHNDLKARKLIGAEPSENAGPEAAAESNSGGYWIAKRAVQFGSLKFSDGQRIEGVREQRLKDSPRLVEWIPE